MPSNKFTPGKSIVYMILWFGGNDKCRVRVCLLMLPTTSTDSLCGFFANFSRFHQRFILLWDFIDCRMHKYALFISRDFNCYPHDIHGVHQNHLTGLKKYPLSPQSPSKGDVNSSPRRLYCILIERFSDQSACTFPMKLHMRFKCKVLHFPLTFPLGEIIL